MVSLEDFINVNLALAGPSIDVVHLTRRFLETGSRVVFVSAGPHCVLDEDPIKLTLSHLHGAHLSSVDGTYLILNITPGDGKLSPILYAAKLGLDLSQIQIVLFPSDAQIVDRFPEVVEQLIVLFRVF